MNSLSFKSSKYNLYVEDNGMFCVSNTVTSSMILLESDEYLALKENNISYFGDEDRELLYNQGLIVQEDLDETALLRYAYFSSKLSSNEAHLTICPTLECNFSCPYCYEKRERGFMSKEVQNKLFSFVEQLAKLGVNKFYLMWYGGEPLLYPDIIQNVTKEIKLICDKYHSKLIVSMISNGYLIDKCLDVLKEIDLTRIQITLDGEKETHDKRRFLRDGTGTFERVLNNIILASTFTKVTVRVNIDRTNIIAFQKIKNYFLENENIECYCSPVTIEENQCEAIKNSCFTVEQYGEFYKLTGSEPFYIYDGGIKCCSAEMKNTYVIDPDGDIYKCLNDIGKKQHKLSTLEKINEFENPSIVSKYLGRDPFTEETCKDCLFLPQCYGGCVWVYRDKSVHSCKHIKYSLLDDMKKMIEAGR